jgi:hypothetical protein
MPYSDNFYPGLFNFPMPSFIGSVTPPDVDPDEGETILVAYNPDWSPVLMAACNQLLLYSSWEGTHDEKILATERAANLKIQLITPFDVPERNYPAPYWDEETDADDDLPEAEQDWYGLVEDAAAPPDELTFVQNAVIWLFTGFVLVAASPSLVGSIGAAITFRTLANRFVLSFNKGDVREQIRVIIDAQDYGEVDTDDIPDGEVMDMTVNGLTDADFHDIMIITTNPV